jgi:hypothetical protein
MLRLFFAFFLVALGLGPQIALATPPSTPVMAAPEPDVLVAQLIDDSDLRNEETLEELHDIEFDREAKSVKRAVTSSFIPGAGWGLLYAKKDAQSVVPFALSVVGYGLGALFLGGVFSQDQTQICQHTREGRVALDECFRGDRADNPENPNIISNLDVDRRSSDMATPYFQTKGDYEIQEVGKSIDGQKVGAIVLIATYAITTTIGAMWAGSTIHDYNKQLRRDIESTAQNDSPTITPVAAIDRDGGIVGFSVAF